MGCWVRKGESVYIQRWPCFRLPKSIIWHWALLVLVQIYCIFVIVVFQIKWKLALKHFWKFSLSHTHTQNVPFKDRTSAEDFGTQENLKPAGSYLAIGTFILDEVGFFWNSQKPKSPLTNVWGHFFLHKSKAVTTHCWTYTLLQQGHCWLPKVKIGLDSHAVGW